MMGDLVLSGKMTSKEVAEKYGISANNIRLFTNKRKMKGNNYEKKGRCPKLDMTSENAIRDHYINKNYKYQFNSVKDFKLDIRGIIVREAIKSYQRSTDLSNNNKVISVRTLNRKTSEYFNELKASVNIINL